MADELQTVPVIVRNFTDNKLPQYLQDNLKNISEGIQSLQNIYGDTNKFKAFERKFNSIEGNIKNIWSLLSSKLSSTPEPTPPAPHTPPTPPAPGNPDVVGVEMKLDTVIGLLNSILNKEYCKCTGRGPEGGGGGGGGGGSPDDEESNDSGDNSLEEALKGAQEQEKKDNAERDKSIGELPASIKSLQDTLKGLKDVVVKGFSDTFNKWDNQIRTLKESGMGAQNAAELNRLTSRTMWATEETLGWNVSIDKAIKTTNDMMAAGMNPRYVRENNKQLLMGLESIGLQLQPDTIREFGNAVFDATNVRELTEGWARILSPDTENAVSKEDLSRFLDSAEYKQMSAVIMRSGQYNVVDIQKAMQESILNAIKAGFTGQEALRIAQVETQAKLGGGAYGPLPENVQTLIGAAQMAGTFNGVQNLSESLLQATKVFNSDMQARSKMLSASAGLAMGGDYSLHSMFTLNDGHTRRIATTSEIEEGQYEGTLPRLGKRLANLLPAESTGAYAQQLTGDSSFFTNAAGSLVKGIFSDIKDGGAIFYLRKIANNTEKDNPGGGGLFDFLSSKFPRLGGFLSKAGPIALGIGAVATAVTAVGGTVSLLRDESKQAEQRAQEGMVTVQEFMAQESALQQQLNEAKLNGDQASIERIQKQLDAVHSKTDQQIDEVIAAQELSSDKTWAANAGIIGAIVVGVGAALIATGLGAPVGALLLAGAGGIAAGGLGAAAATDAITTNVGPDYEEERAKIRSGGGYAEGGLVEEEQIATLGEGNKPELILPLTKPDRVSSLVRQARNSGYLQGDIGENFPVNGVTEITQNSFFKNIDKGVLDVVEYISSQLKSLKDINNILEENFGGDAREEKSRKEESEITRNQLFVSNLGLPVKALITESKPVLDSDIIRNPEGVVLSGLSPITGSLNQMQISNNEMMEILNRLDESDRERILREREKLAEERNNRNPIQQPIQGYAEGGLIEEEQIAKVGEGNQPELILPLTNPQRTEGLIEEAILNPSTNEEVVDILSRPNTIDQRLLYNRAVASYSKDLKDNPRMVSFISPDLLNDILQSSLEEDTNTFYVNLENFNPFGVKDQLGRLKKYDSMDTGIREFVSSIEQSFDNLNKMSYKQQLQSLRDSGYISKDEYNRTSENNKDKLVESLNELNKSVQESNRISRNNRPIPNLTPMAQRRY